MKRFLHSAFRNLQSASKSSAAYEMDDLDLVAVPDFRDLPILTPNDRFVQFNGDSLSGHIETGEEIVQLKSSIKFFCLAINKNSHIKMIQEFLGKS